jgi:hypothetical protein
MLGIDTWALTSRFNIKVDIPTMCISVVGIMVTAFYLLIRNPEQNLPLPELGLSSSKAIDDNLDAVLKDYETTNNEIQRRENTTMIVESFLIAASLLILANTAVSSPVAVMAEVALNLSVALSIFAVSLAATLRAGYFRSFRIAVKKVL